MAGKSKKEKEAFVTEEKFNELQESVGILVGLVKQQIADKEAEKSAVPPVPETPIEKEIKKAGPNHSVPVNPEWEQVARDIIGDAVDHCEMQHLRSGGLIFHVIIKKEYSNASDDYFLRMHEDRRSREIGGEGIGGVEKWCKLIASNLKRGKSYTSSE